MSWSWEIPANCKRDAAERMKTMNAKGAPSAPALSGPDDDDGPDVAEGFISTATTAYAND